MSVEPWSQLSVSVRHALLWAAALARCRDEQQGNDPSSAVANAFDLLVGMLLEHPDDAEPKLLLDHFQLVPGQILPADYPRPMADSIVHQMAAISPDGMPAVDQDVTMIVQQGSDLGMSSGSPEVAELRALFAAMLETSNPVASAFGERFAQRETSLSEIARSLREYVETYKEGHSSYARFLQERHPFSPRPVDIPNYKADHGRQIELADDMIDIHAEVDAFAYLLASRGLSPPLAVGLFGDWGSGKSFFMESVCNRIARLTSDPQLAGKPQCEVPFWKRIIQIKFNAWHYVEGELWASLVDHIFNQLRLHGDSEDLVRQRREHWLEKLDHTRAKMVRLESKRSEATRDLQAKQQQAELLRRQRDSEQANLERLKAQAASAIVIRNSLEEVNQALAPYLIAVGVPTAEEIFSKLDAARAELRRGRVMLDLMWRDPQDRTPLILSLIGVPLLVWWLSLLDVSAVTSAFAGLSATAASGLKLLGRATELIRSRLDQLESAQQEVRLEVEAAQTEFNEKIEAAEQSIQAADARLKNVIVEQQTLTDELKRIQTQLEQVTPARVLTDFVAERVGSGDYRKHLGIPALIQQDFRQLSNLVAQQNAAILEDKQGTLEQSVDCFNRIILYIDDLDRCPDKRVIEVLQAVHLMLAFKLFVVVVAVDSRWLRHALTKRFKALSANQVNHREATPDDYLEKIFQIPFWIEPIGETAKRNIIQGLLRSHLVSGAGTSDTQTGGDKPTVGKSQLQVLATLDPASSPPNLEAAALSITPVELQFLDALAPLLGSTPRSTKRFVNLYQLVRIIHRLDPGGPSPVQPPEYELLALVLALGEGLPKLGPLVLKAALIAQPEDDFQTLLERNRACVDAQQLKRLDDWLDTRANWKQIPAGRIAAALRKVDRFLFRVGALNPD